MKKKGLKEKGEIPVGDKERITAILELRLSFAKRSRELINSVRQETLGFVTDLKKIEGFILNKSKR
jgi:hypothetical protein